MSDQPGIAGIHFMPHFLAGVGPKARITPEKVGVILCGSVRRVWLVGSERMSAYGREAKCLILCVFMLKLHRFSSV